jgi:hypothetical protein
MQTDTALYIKIHNRGWCIWRNPQNELMAIPEDEKPYTQKDLQMVAGYLDSEGFLDKI